MKVWKRVLAFLCAALLIFNLALYPLRARATVGALTAVSAAVTVSAFLMACGIYPYVEDGQSFGEWGAQSLYDLWSQYVDTLEAPPNGGTTQEAFNNIKSFVVGGTLAIASGTWETLRGFASWIVEKFKVQDNQSEVQIGVSVGDGHIPVIAYQDGVSAGQTRQYGLLAYEIGNTAYYFGNSKSSDDFDVYMIYTDSGLDYYQIFFFSLGTEYIYGGENGVSYGHAITNSLTDSQYPGEKYWFNTNGQISAMTDVTWHIPFVPWQGSPFLTARYFFDGHSSNFMGIVADTTTVAPLEPLPADTPYGGLSVPGAGVSPTATAVEDVIETGVTDREKPVVRPVEIEIQQGTEVDSETGEITENPVVITPEDVVPTVAALSPPASFISALQTTITTKFPFCLPFDLFKILQAFYVPPEAPVFSLSFHDPFSNSDFSITVDLSPWDEVAAVVRTFEAMILLAGFCLNFDKFNVIHLILGGLG